ncbi:MAG TPA: hypothetical protein VF456_13290, partial [Vicinamibacterales bacterium]
MAGNSRPRGNSNQRPSASLLERCVNGARHYHTDTTIRTPVAMLPGTRNHETNRVVVASWLKDSKNHITQGKRNV